MKKKWQLLGIATTVNLLLFIFFLVFIRPIYNTNEDVYILYMLSGGFGNTSTDLLHYNHIVHPCLGIVLKNLFILNDTFNWYTLALLISHFAACTIIFFQILLKNKTLPFILFYLLLIIVFELRLLLTINFTNTAIVTGLSGIVLLFTAEKQGRLSIRQILAGCLVILLASFWRIHVLIPVIGLALPFFLLLSYKNSIVIAGALVITGGLILSFNYLHQMYYKSNIAGWQQEEDYRQKIYQFYNTYKLNNPKPGEKWHTEYNLIRNGLPVDTFFLSSAQLNNMVNDLKENNNYVAKKNTGNKNWFWINNRIFFFTILLLLTSIKINTKEGISVIVSLLLIISGLTYLNLYFKLSDYILIACLFSNAVFILLTTIPKPANYTYGAYARMFISICLCFWGIICLYKLNEKQVKQIYDFKMAYSEIAQKKDTLFIITGDMFPLQKFYIFDVPKQYSLPNFLDNDHFLLNMQTPVFNRFQITGIKETPNHPALFWGRYVPALENYFYFTSGNKVHFSQPLNEFKFGSVYTITNNMQQLKSF